MRGFNYPARVLKGVAYLNVTYPKWWHGVDSAALDMYDFRGHILAQVHGCLVYETKEFVFWPRHTLAIHGFMPLHGTHELKLLTEEWSFQVRKRWKEGK